MAIRYDKALQGELQRTVRNFNSKINRLKKIDSNLNLPEKVSIRELKNKYTNRRDLKREIENLKLFQTRNIEESVTTKGGVKTSKYELEVMKRESRRIKGQITRELKRRETTKIKTFGREEDVTYAEIGDRSYLNLKARRTALDKDFTRLTKEAFESYRKLLQRAVNKRHYDFNDLQYNWANEMLMPIAYMSGYDMSKLESVSSKISSLSERNFLDLFNDEEIMKAITEDYASLRDGTIDEREIKLIHERLDKLVSDIDYIIKDYV